MKRSILRFGYYTFFLTLLFSGTARAYLDPATLTYVIQIVAGAFIACGAAVAIFWRRIRRFFQKRFGKGAKNAEPPAASEAVDNTDVVNPMNVNPMDASGPDAGDGTGI